LPANGLILEGITGAGKSTLLRALRASTKFAQFWPAYDLYREKETFGEFMGELIENPSSSDQCKLRLLNQSVESIERRCADFVLERAHFSYYALLPKWELYAWVDERLAARNARTVLLEVPEADLRTRSLYRVDRGEAHWAGGFIDLYGSEESALSTMRRVQQLRREGIERSACPYLVIDSCSMQWDQYIDEIIAFLKAP